MDDYTDELRHYEEEGRYYRRVAGYEISWNHTTWKDWLPMMIGVGLLSITVIGLGIYSILQ